MALRDAPDLILTGGKILTVDESFRIEQAVAITDGRFAATGDDKDITALAGPQTRVIDLAGRTAMPGLIDGHAHMDNEGLKYIYPSLAGARSVSDILRRIEALAAERDDGEWIITMPVGDPPYYRNVPDILREKRFPTRWELDDVAPRNPVYIKPVYGYWRGLGGFPLTSVANSLALAIAGIDQDTVPPWDGIEIERDPVSGEANGIFNEWAPVSVVETTLMNAVPRFSTPQRYAALQESMAVYNAFGTTSVVETHGVAAEVTRLYRDLDEAGQISVRSHLMLSVPWDSARGTAPAEILDTWYGWAAGHGLGNPMLRIGGLFARVGGSPDAALRTRAMPYTGWCGFAPDSEQPRDKVREIVIEAARRRFRVTTLYPDILDIFEEAARIAPIHNLRWVIGHIRTLTSDEISRIRDLGIAVTTQTNRWIADRGPDMCRELGPDRADELVPLRRLTDAGVPFALATDNCPPSLFHPIWHCIARRHPGTGEEVAPSQRLTREETIRAATRGGAYLTFEENLKGSIEAGKFADMIVLSDDIMTVHEDRIKDIVSELTIVGGKIVHGGDEPSTAEPAAPPVQ